MSVATKPATELLTIGETAVVLNCSPSTIRRRMNVSPFPAPIRLGVGLQGKILFRRAKIEQWLRDGCPRNSESEVLSNVQ